MKQRMMVAAVAGSVLAMALQLGSAARLYATIQQESVAVVLRAGRVGLSQASTDSFMRALRATPAEALHGLAAFRSPPNDSARSVLAQLGLTVLTPVQGRVYLVRVAKTLDRDDDLVRSLVASLALIRPADKVARDVWEERYERFAISGPEGDTNYVRNRDGTLSLLVAFHPATPAPRIAAVLRSHARSFDQLGNTDWRVVVTRAGLLGLAGEDIVLAIDPVPPPIAREWSAIGVDTVTVLRLASLVPLTGAGVQVGVFDGGLDEEHDDFDAVIAGALGPSRVILGDPARRSHATLVAGMIAGSGWRSDKKDSWQYDNNGTPFQWRGVAPESQLIDAAIFKPGFIDFTTNKVLGYIQSQGMDLSNHSYGVGHYGNGRNLSALHDRVIRGDELVGTISIPPRLEVLSAGNHLDSLGYFSLNNELKNGLVVGNWSPERNRIQPESSIGPTTDGRLKPDVVAPGTAVYTTGSYQPPEDPKCKLPEGTPPASDPSPYPRRQFYCLSTGTSIAAPTVTGMLALVLQQYAGTYGVNLDQHPPLPSTLRALAIHSAWDVAAGNPWFTTPDPKIQAFPGPDFVTGWGLVDPDGAVDLVKRRLITGGRLAQTCETLTFPFRMATPPGAHQPDSVKVTLAWDDPPDDLIGGAQAPRLKNDLDLVLIDPNGVRHYPWLLDQQITDQLGNPLAPDRQQCGFAVGVKRALDPDTDVVPAAAIVPATFGRDHLNNVEQVVAEGIPGRWRIEVSGFKLMSPQDFSLIGVRIDLFRPDWRDFCAARRAACAAWLPDLCRRYPVVCRRQQEVPIHPRGVTVTFQDPRDRVILPVPDLCAHLGAADACYRPGTAYELAIGPSSSGVGVEVYSARGRRAAGEVSARTAYRLALAPEDGESLLVLSPSADTRIGVAYRLLLTLRPR